jgi:imidazolonepropionase-like amidohydrolase
MPYAIVPKSAWIGDELVTKENLAVIIEADRIIDICGVDELPVDIIRINRPDCTLLPGFIDVHVHLDSWMEPLFLAYGITTVRDTGNHLQWILNKQSKLSSPASPGPYVECCGPLLDAEKYYHNNISWGIRSSEDMEEAVDFLHKAGLKAIKLYADLSDQLFHAGLKRAKEYNMHTLTHLGKVSLDAAIHYGIDEIEHLEGLPSEYDEERVRHLGSSGVWSVPTQVVYAQSLTYKTNEEAHAIEPFIPRNTKRAWRRWLETLYNEQEPNEKFIALQEFVTNRRKYLTTLIEMKAPLAIGTDPPFLCVIPGYAYFHELDEFRSCGMSARDIVKTATISNATLIGIGDETGSIKIGKRADLCLFRGDPLSDFNLLKMPELVIKGGFMHDPQELFRSMREGVPEEDIVQICGRAVHFIPWQRLAVEEWQP